MFIVGGDNCICKYLSHEIHDLKLYLAMKQLIRSCVNKELFSPY